MDWTEIMITVIGLIFTAVIIPLVTAGFAWIRGKTKNEALRAAITEAQTVADQVVAGLQANLVDELKATNGGKLDAEQIKEISYRAFDAFKSDLSERSMLALQKNADDITAYVKNLIESALADTK